MTTILSVTALAFFSVLFLVDFRRSKGDRSARFGIRSLANAGSAVLILTALLLDRDWNVSRLIVCLMVSNQILTMYPCSFEKPQTALGAALALITVNLAVQFFFGWKEPGGNDLQRHKNVISILVAITSFLAYWIVVSIRKFSGIRLLFRNSAVWNNVEEYARFLYSLLFLGLCIFDTWCTQAPGNFGTGFALFSVLLHLVLYTLLFFRAVTGRTFVLQKETEERIKEMIKGNLRTSYVDKAEEDRRMSNLYKRIMAYMSDKKPFLDSTFSMTDLADSLFSNKLYLSKTINILSGRNFRQFVNYHRIQYAVKLMKMDPRLRVMEVSEMSGFHSVVSFNMAFKMNLGKTPSEWLREYMSRQE